MPRPKEQPIRAQSSLVDVSPGLPQTPWSVPTPELLRQLHVAAEKGLNATEAAARRRRYGANRIRETKTRSAWRILVEQFKSLLVVLLAVAAALSFLFSEWMDGIAIVVVLLLNGMIGFATELRAAHSMEALKRLSRVTARVRREGRIEEIAAADLIPGDIVILEGGDIVSADLRLVEASKLQTDESALTGESLPVSKQVQPVPLEAPLAERSSMVFKGTVVTRGSGDGVVVATGMATELGRISAMVEEAAEEATPLEKRLDLLGRKLIGVTLVITAVVVLLGVLGGKGVLLMVKTGIALAVAAVPEGLPIVATVALARGMLRMARRNAIINRLSAVETLGATSIICTDKTGTLTENRMTATQLVLASGEIDIPTGQQQPAFIKKGQPVSVDDDEILREALEVALLCSNAWLPQDQGHGHPPGIGDPLEVALLVAGARGGVRRELLLASAPEVREEAFDPETRMMATYHEARRVYRVAVKGAPEAVLEHSTHLRSPGGQQPLEADMRRKWLARNQQMAEGGLRVLALATKQTHSIDARPYADLVFLGLVGLEDPAREGVREAIAACRAAGVRVVMVTGDHPATAKAVACAVGLAEQDDPQVVAGREIRSLDQIDEAQRERLRRVQVFARVEPRQKLNLIRLYQEKGSIVAMTGDGVNDAPALKKADIGIAMGRRGTQVAREAADMVLKDDAFSTIAAAMEEGRVIFGNIRKFVLYLLSCNASEVLTVGLATAVNAPLPILPLQILFLNLVTDIFPALALGAGGGDPEVMRQPPRDPQEPVFTRPHWYMVGGYGLLITLCALASLALGLLWLELDPSEGVTLSFLTLAFAQLFHVFNMRDPGSRILRNAVVGNRYVWAALALCTALLVAAVYVPILSDALEVVPPDARGWGVVLTLSLVPLVVGQIFLSRKGAG